MIGSSSVTNRKPRVVLLSRLWLVLKFLIIWYELLLALTYQEPRTTGLDHHQNFVIRTILLRVCRNQSWELLALISIVVYLGFNLGSDWKLEEWRGKFRRRIGRIRRTESEGERLREREFGEGKSELHWSIKNIISHPQLWLIYSLTASHMHPCAMQQIA